MKEFFQKPYRWALVYSVFLAALTAYVLLDTFVIPKSMAIEPPSASSGSASYENQTELEASPAVEKAPAVEPLVQQEASPGEGQAQITATSYRDENIQIDITTQRAHDTTFYAADIQLADASYLRTALARGTFGRNIKETTSAIADENGALLAVNGDYYGFRDNGFVLRNGILYRGNARETGNDQCLVIDGNGDFKIIYEGETEAQQLSESGVWQAFSFGPALVEDGIVIVDSSDEVGQAKKSNPRTAIGQVGPLHYIIIVSDGRTEESTGLSLLQLAREFADRGCTAAYNLDGGGSSTMVFQGQVVNHPANGRKSKERAVSDIVYIGY